MKRFLMIATASILLANCAFAADLSANATYKAKCAMCHGANGEGKEAMKVPAFKAGKSDAELTKAIAEGVKPKMPAFQGKISDDEIKALVAEIKKVK